MRKGLLLTLLTIAIALPSFADDRERHQSFISYDDGGSVVKSGEDGREIDAQRNLPIYPGDEVVTGRRGRTEVRLSDGNIIGIDRATSVRFRSILDSYDGEANETVAELRYGKVAVQRTDIGRDHVRLDTDHASYVASYEAIYSVESDSHGDDRVIVFEGNVEVRTPSRTTRLRRGEGASVSERGVYDLVGDQRVAADDFESWFLRRAQREASRSSRYVDRRLGYWTDDLDDHGSWVFVTGIGWSWRPFVSVGWRPYYNGYWHSRNGCLTWVSYDPWGWGTYHYGRWAYDPFNGWIWVPGSGYSPAWVYWMYGSNYVGWAPAGWWDCHRGYYNWAYQPYRRGFDFGFGFYGRVRVNELDLRPWTVVDSHTLISTRIDRAALTTDAIRGRLARNTGGYATVASGATRFTREEVRDPAEAIRRRALDPTREGRLTGRETGAAGAVADMTPFFRRDADPGAAIRDRITRTRGTATPGGGTTSTTPSRTAGGLAPIGGGNLAPIGRGNVAPITGGSPAPIARGGDDSGSVSNGGTVDRRNDGSTAGRINRGDWRNRGNDATGTPATTTPS
ncbi:MAG TPA: FecR family protein, partial [Thermoanaerobaculia bacterium]